MRLQHYSLLRFSHQVFYPYPLVLTPLPKGQDVEIIPNAVMMIEKLELVNGL
jgi:hypothetical protein